MPGDPRPIGVFDSGMGGLTVLRAMEAQLPAETFLYLGDTARLPYGTKSAETVQAYALQATRLLVSEGVKMVVIACNTASAVALGPLASELAPVPVIGVIEPGARAGVAATRNQHIAIIATEGTVKGGAYARAISALNGAIRVVQQPCQVFVALAEEGWTESDVTLTAAGRYLGPLFAGRRRPTRSCSVAPIFPCLRGSSGTSSAPTRGPGGFRRDHGGGGGDALPPRASPCGKPVHGAPPSRARTKFLATDSPERFARVGEIFLGRPIDASEVELVDLRPWLERPQMVCGGVWSGNAAESTSGSGAPASETPERPQPHSHPCRDG